MFKCLIAILPLLVLNAAAQVKKSDAKTIRIVHAESWSFDKEKQSA